MKRVRRGDAVRIPLALLAIVLLGGLLPRPVVDHGVPRDPRAVAVVEVTARRSPGVDLLAAAPPRPRPVLKSQDSPRQVGLVGVLGLLFVCGLVVSHVRVLRAVSAAGRRSTDRPAPDGRPEGP